MPLSYWIQTCPAGDWCTVILTYGVELVDGMINFLHFSFKGTVSRDFWTIFFLVNQLHIGPWLLRWKNVEYRFEFDEIFEVVTDSKKTFCICLTMVPINDTEKTKNPIFFKRISLRIQIYIKNILACSIEPQIGWIEGKKMVKILVTLSL